LGPLDKSAWVESVWASWSVAYIDMNDDFKLTFARNVSYLGYNVIKSKIMKSIFLVAIWIAIASCLFAQKETITIEKEVEKVVSVDVSKGDDGMRKFKIVTDQEGQKKVIEWMDDGTIPPEVVKQLEAANIDISILQPGGNEEMMEVEVEVDATDDQMVKTRKKMIVMKSNDDDGDERYEWNGQGEMPAEIQKLLDEHDIDLDSFGDGDGDGDGDKRIRIRKRIEEDRGRRRRAVKRGRRMNQNEVKSFKIMSIGEDGEKEVIELEMEICQKG